MADDVRASVGADLSSLDAALNQAASNAQAAAGKIGAAFDQVGQSATAAGSAVDGLGSRIAGASSQLAEMGSSLQSAGSGLMLLGGALSTVSAAIIGLGVGALDAAGNMEVWQVSFTNLLHSSEAATSMLKDLVDFAVRTPFQIPGVIEAAQRLVNFGFSAEKVIPLLTTLGDAASAAGHGVQGLNTLVLAFGEMQEKGVIQLRQLNMLVPQGVNGIELLAKAYDVSVTKMTDMISKKLIPASEGIPILLAGMAERSGGQMEKIATTFKGAMSNISDDITKTLAEVGKNLLPLAKSVQAAVFSALEEVQALAQSFGRLPVPAQQAAFAVAGLAAALGPLLLAGGATIYMLGGIATALPAISSLATTVNAAFAALISSTSLASAAIAGLSAAAAAVGFAIFVTEIIEIGREVQSLYEKLRTITSLSQVHEFFSRLGEVITGARDKLLDLSKQIPIVGELLAKMSQVTEALGPRFKNVYDYVATMTWSKFVEQSSVAVQALELLGKALDFVYTKLTGFTDHTELSVAQNRAFKQSATETAVALDEHGKSAFRLSTTIDALRKTQQDANHELVAAKAALDEVKRLYAAGAASTDEVARATLAYTKALRDAHPEIKAVKDSVEDLTAKLIKAQTQYQNEIKAYERMVDLHRQGKVSLGLLAEAYDEVQKKAKKAHETFFDVNAEIDKMVRLIGIQQQALGDSLAVWERLKDIPGQQLATAEALNKVSDAAHRLGLSVIQIGDALQFDVIDKGAPTAGALQKIVDQLNALSTGASNVALINLNGKLVPALNSVAASGGAAAVRIGENIRVFNDLPGAAGGAAASVMVLGGATEAASRQTAGMTAAAQSSIQTYRDLPGAASGAAGAITVYRGAVTAATSADAAWAARQKELSQSAISVAAPLLTVSQRMDGVGLSATNCLDPILTLSQKLEGLGRAASDTHAPLLSASQRMDSAAAAAKGATSNINSLAEAYRNAASSASTLAQAEKAAGGGGSGGSGNSYADAESKGWELAKNTNLGMGNGTSMSLAGWLGFALSAASSAVASIGGNMGPEAIDKIAQSLYKLGIAASGPGITINDPNSFGPVSQPGFTGIGQFSTSAAQKAVDSLGKAAEASTSALADTVLEYKDAAGNVVSTFRTTAAEAQKMLEWMATSGNAFSDLVASTTQATGAIEKLSQAQQEAAVKQETVTSATMNIPDPPDKSGNWEWTGFNWVQKARNAQVSDGLQSTVASSALSQHATDVQRGALFQFQAAALQDFGNSKPIALPVIPNLNPMSGMTAALPSPGNPQNGLIINNETNVGTLVGQNGITELVDMVNAKQTQAMRQAGLLR